MKKLLLTTLLLSLAILTSCGVQDKVTDAVNDTVDVVSDVAENTVDTVEDTAKDEETEDQEAMQKEADRVEAEIQAEAEAEAENIPEVEDAPPVPEVLTPQLENPVIEDAPEPEIESKDETESSTESKS